MSIDLYEVVTRLNGPIMPVGDSRIDEARLSNLKVLCGLVTRLVADIDAVASERGEHMASVKEAKHYANHFLDTLGITE